MSKDKKADRINTLVIAALFAALTTVATMIHIFPNENGYVHLGDAVIYLAASCLPGTYAFVAAAVGGALADAIGGYFIYVPVTFLVKGLLTLTFTGRRDKLLCARNFIACAVGLVITVGGYFAAEWIMYGWASAVGAVLGNLIQAGASAALYIVLALALDKIGFKKSVLGRGA